MLQQAKHRFDGRAFACPVGPDDSHEFAGHHVEPDVTDRRFSFRVTGLLNMYVQY
ncbi:hypothetical protein D1872_331810 [compost metagenome]